MQRPRDQRGAAVVDFVLVLLVLIPLVLGILQTALVLFVRNTAAAAASEGARYGAAHDRGPRDAEEMTRRQLDGVLPERFAERVVAREGKVGGAPGVVVTVQARVPALGLGGPAVEVTVTGRAVREPT